MLQYPQPERSRLREDPRDVPIIPPPSVLRTPVAELPLRDERCDMPRTLQELFVNRERQLEAFRRMLDGAITRRIMIITAAAGMGKSWLLQIFADQALARGVLHVRIDFADDQAYDVLKLVRVSRDALGAEHFGSVTEVINEATTARVAFAAEPAAQPVVSVAIGDGSTLQGSPVSVGEVGTIIKDNYFVVQTDNPLIRQVIEDRVNRAFFDDLAALASRQQVVFLFDTYERNSIEADRWVANTADRWVTGQLLARIRDGRLANVVVVIAGEQAPEFGVEWNRVLGRMSLDPLSCDDVKQYLRHRRGLATITEPEADRLCQAVAGHPQVLGMIGDNLERANNPASQDDEW